MKRKKAKYKNGSYPSQINQDRGVRVDDIEKSLAKLFGKDASEKPYFGRL